MCPKSEYQRHLNIRGYCQTLGSYGVSLDTYIQRTDEESVCVWICVYVCMYMRICIFICLHMCICVNVCVYVWIFMFVCMCMCTCICIWVCMYLCLYMCVNVCVYAFTCGHMWLRAFVCFIHPIEKWNYSTSRKRDRTDNHHKPNSEKTDITVSFI